MTPERTVIRQQTLRVLGKNRRFAMALNPGPNLCSGCSIWLMRVKCREVPGLDCGLFYIFIELPSGERTGD